VPLPPSNRRVAQAGFTLIEMLIVMIIVGILAAIAIPVMLSQRAAAHDASTKADVTVLGKEIAAYHVDGGSGLDLDLAVQPGRAVLSDDSGVVASIDLTKGTAVPSAGAASNLGDERTWCVALADPAGAIGTFRYSAADGLEAGTC
jgi:prepilin-type N-terminal cleavage/methylation domain-containing protein